MNKIIPFLVGGFLLIGTVGCQQGTNNADSTGTTNESPVNQVKKTADKTADAVKNTADKTATTVKNTTDGAKTTVKNAVDGAKTTVPNNSGVETIVANRLKEKFPNSQLQVSNKDGVLTISGVVPNEETLKKIAPTVKEYKFQGIKDVKVEAKVADKKPQ